jgi:hypothetical protein
MTQSGHARTRNFYGARACESKRRIVPVLEAGCRGELPLPPFDLLTCDPWQHQAAETVPTWAAHYCAPSRDKADGFVSLFDGARDGLTHTPVNSGNGIGTGGVGARGNIGEWYYAPYLVLLVGTRERVVTLSR